MKKVIKKVGYYVVLAILAAIAVVCFKVSWDTMDGDSRALCLAGGALILMFGVIAGLNYFLFFYFFPTIWEIVERRRKKREERRNR